MRKFSKKELTKYDGKEGRKAYIAHDGLVYDVTDSFLWKDGKHQAIHFAGNDLTEELKKAPHGIDFLKRYLIIGKLKDS